MAPPATPATNQAATVALVDDDPSVRRALGRLLVSAGYSVRAFASAHELLDSGVARLADCFLLDVHLVGMSGLELAERLRADGADRTVIFMTAHDSDETRQQAGALGASAYLRKPFDAGALLEAVRCGIAEREARARRRPKPARPA